MRPYRIVRSFGNEDAPRRLTMVLELPVEPRRGLDVLLPDDPEPLRVVRVVARARQPVRPQWEPGFASLTWITVELEREPADEHAPAVANGWKADEV